MYKTCFYTVLAFAFLTSVVGYQSLIGGGPQAMVRSLAPPPVYSVQPAYSAKSYSNGGFDIMSCKCIKGFSKWIEL